MTQLGGLDASIKRLAELLSQGVVTLAEFDQQRKELLSKYIAPSGRPEPAFQAPRPSRANQGFYTQQPQPTPYRKGPVSNNHQIQPMASPVPPLPAYSSATRYPPAKAKAPAPMPARAPTPAFTQFPIPARNTSLQPMPSPGSYRPPIQGARRQTAPSNSALRWPASNAAQPSTAIVPAGARTLYPAPAPARALARPGPMRNPMGTQLQASRFHPYAPPAARPKGQAITPAPPLPNKPRGGRTVIVRPVPDGVQAEQLMDGFSMFGEVTNAVVQRGEEGALGRAVVTFAIPEAAQGAIDAQYIDIDGALCFVQRDIGRSMTKKPAPSSTLIISNLPDRVSKAELVQMLAPYQGFKDVLPPVPPMNGLPGYCCARFTDAGSAAAAKGSLNGVVVQGHLVEASFATSVTTPGSAVLNL